MASAIKTKIVATIGPASRDRTTLEKIFTSGVSVARLNFSHGSYEDHVEVIRSVRSISRTMNQSIGILLDLQGPKIRVGKLQDGKPVELARGNPFTITTQSMAGTAQCVSTTYTGLPFDVAPQDPILLDDGLIRLRVVEVKADRIQCVVTGGGILKENKGINLPGVAVSAPSLTEKDKRDQREHRIGYGRLSEGNVAHRREPKKRRKRVGHDPGHDKDRCDGVLPVGRELEGKIP